jgi:hypothetical protein
MSMAVGPTKLAATLSPYTNPLADQTVTKFSEAIGFRLRAQQPDESFELRHGQPIAAQTPALPAMPAAP